MVRICIGREKIEEKVRGIVGAKTGKWEITRNKNISFSGMLECEGK